jgi:hypothetical protein
MNDLVRDQAQILSLSAIFERRGIWFNIIEEDVGKSIDPDITNGNDLEFVLIHIKSFQHIYYVMPFGIYSILSGNVT